uniref:Zgc:113208 n=2 Tax=Latimeria chalumnae TaxID=7897 RepID=H3AQW3_LATCH
MTVKLKKEEKKKCIFNAPLPTRNAKGQLLFEDFPTFQPNMTPEEILQSGSFGGTYFRPIYSSVTKQNYQDVWKELPKTWIEGLDIKKQVSSAVYRPEVNKYKVKCGGSLEMWESSGWILPQDPYGWFQWYCRFYQGRRSPDDECQIGRWERCAGVKGRWRQNLITKIVRSNCTFNDPAVSPVVRQTLQHWGYQLTQEDYEKGAKKVQKK